MVERKHVTTLFAGILFAFASAVSGQDSECPKEPQPCPVREKPYAEAAPPARTIAPRDLPTVYEQEAERAEQAARVVNSTPGSKMVANEVAVAVFPRAKKGAFIIGAEWGKGLMTMRGDDGHWLPPSYVQMTGGNVGLHAGFESIDLVLVFTNKSAIKSILTGKLTLNGAASATAGAVGRDAEAGVPIILESGIYAWSSAKGLYAGASLDGAVITVDSTANKRVYGKHITGKDILLDRRVEPNTVVAPFLNALELNSPALSSHSAQAQPVHQ